MEGGGGGVGGSTEVNLVVVVNWVGGWVCLHQILYSALMGGLHNIGWEGGCVCIKYFIVH